MPVLSFDSRSTISGLNVCVNTWHVSVNGQPLITEANNIINAVNTFFNGLAAYRPTGSNVVTGSRVLYFQESWWTKPVGKPGTSGYVKGFFNTPPFIQGATPATSTVGTGTGSLPPQLATVVSWRTAISGRSGRGRTYLGNLSLTAQNGAVVVAACVTAINTGATTLISAIHALTAAGAAPDLGIWSPTKGVIQPVLTGASDATFDTMRSRVK